MPRSDNSICTSGRWPASTAVSQGLTVSRYSSPPFGSHCTCWNSEPCSLNLGPVPIARWIAYGSIGQAVRLLHRSHEPEPPQQEHVSIPHRSASAMSADFPTRSSPSWAHCWPHCTSHRAHECFPMLGQAAHRSSLFAFTMHREATASQLGSLGFPRLIRCHRMVCREVRTLVHASAVDSLVRVSRRGGGRPEHVVPVIAIRLYRSNKERSPSHWLSVQAPFHYN